MNFQSYKKKLTISRKCFSQRCHSWQGLAPTASVAAFSPPLKSYPEKSKLKSLCLCHILSNYIASAVLHLLKPGTALFNILAERRCSFSRTKVVILTFPSTCFQQPKSPQTSYLIHKSLPETQLTPAGRPFTWNTFCNYTTTVQSLRGFKGLQ